MTNKEKLVRILIDKKLQIATMESCTGGALANRITQVEGSSEILKFSAITYSNEYKIKMGVSKEIIDTYSVYSKEVAKEMSRNIAIFANSDIGVGITGKINRFDPNNPYGKDNLIYYHVYFPNQNKDYSGTIQAVDGNRQMNQNRIVDIIIDHILDIISSSHI